MARMKTADEIAHSNFCYGFLFNEREIFKYYDLNKNKTHHVKKTDEWVNRSCVFENEIYYVDKGNLKTILN
ncbi:hypothetical protein ACFL1H_08355, partial [Nanoarchaeota archaeon]